MAARQYGSDEQARRRKIDRTTFAVVCFAVAMIFTLLETEPDQWLSIGEAYTKACVEFTGVSTEVPEGRMVIHMIDVGQGDSVLVQSGSANILIDAGEVSKGDDVVDYLHSHGVTELDWVICTHPHSDHAGGLTAVIEEMTVDNFMLPDIPERFVPDDRFYTNLMEAIEERGIQLTKACPGTVYSFGDMKMTVLWPDPEFNGADLNDWSIALRFSLGEIDYLCCGDMTDGAEDDLISAGYDIHSEIVKSNHHGSNYANGSDFLYATAPELALISCGLDNDYGHPHDELLYRYEYYNIKWKRTDVCGDIRIICENGQYTIETQN